MVTFRIRVQFLRMCLLLLRRTGEVVSLKEIDRKTFGSKLISGLYITGEAVDIDGVSGGYNLQACMSEAYLAAKSILSKQ